MVDVDGPGRECFLLMESNASGEAVPGFPHRDAS